MKKQLATLLLCLAAAISAVGVATADDPLPPPCFPECKDK